MTFQKVFRDLFRYTIALLLAVPAIALLAFGPRGIDSPPKDRVIVNYWEKWTGREGAAIQGIVDDFNATEGVQKGIFVRCLGTSDPEQKTLIATAAGVPPDIAGLYDFDVAQFAARGALLPLDEMARAHGITDKTFKKVFWDESHFEGTLYGIVNTGYNTGLYYNKKMLAAAGLDPEKPPASIAELDEYSKRIEKKDASGNIEIAGFLPTEPGWIAQFFPFWFGGNWWDDTNKRFRFLDPHVVDSYKWMQSFPKRLGAEAVATYHSGVGAFDSPQNPFFEQTIAMELQGTFFANFIDQSGPALTGNWMAAPMPAEDPANIDVTYANCDVVVIPRGSKHPREAFEFLAFLTHQDEVEKLAKLHCKISPLAKVSEDFLTHHPNPYVRVFDRLAASPNARGTPPVPIMAEVIDEMNSFTQQLSLLQVTPEAGLAEVQKHMQTKYDALMEELQLRGSTNK